MLAAPFTCHVHVQVSLPTVPLVREFSTSVIMDVLFFSAPLWQQSILEEVAVSMNASWAAVKEMQPDLSDGCVGIVGHSLGSVIRLGSTYAQCGLCRTS